MSHQSKHLYVFGLFRLDAGERLLLREGESVPLTPKTFDLLLALVEHHGHLVEKDELLKLVWPETFVEEANLSYNISLIRRALGDGENGQRYIETVPKRGYRFVATVRRQGDADAAATKAYPPPRTWDASRQIKWMRRRPAFVISLAILLLIGVVGAVGFWRAKRQPDAPGAAIKSIAVLPFKSLNPNEGDAALGMGLADALITKLSGLRQIVVLSTNSVRKYDAMTLDPLAAGREPQVEAVLEANY